MAEGNFFYYRGFPMVRSGNEIYYGSMGDKFVTKLTIRESETYKDSEMPTKVMVQMVPTKMEPIIISQSFPQLQKYFFFTLCKCFYCRKFF